MAQVSILIVDDDPVNMTILDDLLKSAGYDTLLAGGLPSEGAVLVRRGRAFEC